MSWTHGVNRMIPIDSVEAAVADGKQVLVEGKRATLLQAKLGGGEIQ